MKNSGLILMAFLIFLVACAPNDPLLNPTAIFEASTTESLQPTRLPTQVPIPMLPSPTSTKIPSPVPHSPSPVPFITPTALPTPQPPLFSPQVVLQTKIARRFQPLTDGRFAIETGSGFEIYDEQDLTAVAATIAHPEGASSVRLSPSANHLQWHDSNGRLFVQRLSDGKVVLEVPGNPNGWQHPTIMTSPAGNFGWLSDLDIYSDQTANVTLYTMDDGAVVASFEGNSPHFSLNDAYFVRELIDQVIVFDARVPTEPLYRIPKPENFSYLSIDMGQTVWAITYWPRDEQRPFTELRDLAADNVLHTQILAEDELRITISPDGEWLLVYFRQTDGGDIPTVLKAGVRLYETQRGQLIRELLTPPTPDAVEVPTNCDGVRTFFTAESEYIPTGTQFAPNGASFSVTYRSDAGLLTHLYGTETGDLLATFDGHAAAFLQNGAEFVTISETGRVQVWQASSPSRNPQTIATYHVPIIDFAAAENGDVVALLSQQGVQIYSLLEGVQIGQYDATAVALAPDGDTILLGLANGSIEWRRLMDDALLGQFQGHDAPIRQIEVLANEGDLTVFTLAENDCQLNHWRPASGTQGNTIDTTLVFDKYGDNFLESIDRFFLSTDGDLIGGRAWFNYGFAVWQEIDHVEIHKFLEDSPQKVEDIAFQAGGRLFATGERWPVGGPVGPERGGIKLWQIGPERTFLVWERELSQYVQAVAFLPESNLLAVGYARGDVSLMNVQSGQFVGRLETDGSLIGLEVSADGRRIMTVTADGTVTQWVR